MARAQLSDYELLILFYNCLCEYGGKFKPYVERYALLKSLPVGDLHDESLVDEYKDIRIPHPAL
ncbi:MAG: hypothetical protein KDC92_12315 [Bacteroidetes bacterium]|nr:hypothetical protein [Bacteroidota bacterium]